MPSNIGRAWSSVEATSGGSLLSPFNLIRGERSLSKRSHARHGRAALRSAISLAAILLAGAYGPAFAQALIADGTTQTASGTYNTGTAAGTAGYGFGVLNGGVINSVGPVTIVTGGALANGINATDPGSTVNITHPVSITVSGAPTTTGVVVANGAAVSMTGGGSITADQYVAVSVGGANSRFTGQNLVHRFQSSNHIRRLDRVCRTRCGRRDRD